MCFIQTILHYIDIILYLFSLIIVGYKCVYVCWDFINRSRFSPSPRTPLWLCKYIEKKNNFKKFIGIWSLNSLFKDLISHQPSAWTFYYCNNFFFFRICSMLENGRSFKIVNQTAFFYSYHNIYIVWVFIFSLFYFLESNCWFINVMAIDVSS